MRISRNEVEKSVAVPPEHLDSACGRLSIDQLPEEGAI